MERATGIGGAFFRSPHPEALARWYAEHLGIKIDPTFSGATFRWTSPGSTVWAVFPSDTNYFGDSGQPWMVNFRVDDLNAMLTQLRAAGVTVDERVGESEFGRFGWAVDPDGNRFELWQPPVGQ